MADQPEMIEPLKEPEKTEEVNNKDKDNDNDNDNEDEHVEDAESPPQTSNPTTSEVPESGALTFKDMWAHSLIFRLIIVGSAAGALAMFIGMILAISGIRFNSERVDYQTDQTAVFKALSDNCTTQENAKDATIKELNAKILSAEAAIANLNNEIKNLTVENANLTDKLNSTEKLVADAKLWLLIWEIGTGVGGALTLGGSGFAWYEASQASTYKAQLDALNVHLQGILKKIKDNAAPLTKYRFFKKDKNIIDKSVCYNSNNYKFNKGRLRTDCKDARGVLIEMRTENDNDFGLYLNEALPIGGAHLYDPKAFVFSVSNGTIGDVIASKAANVINFGSEDATLFDIGEGEVKVAINDGAYTTSVTTNPGNAFNVYQAESKENNIYHETKAFKIKSLIVSQAAIKLRA